MREDDDIDLPPGQRQVGMVALFLGQLTDTINELERLSEVGKEKALGDMVLCDQLPIGKVIGKRAQLGSVKRGDSASAWHAVPVGETAYPRSSHTSPSLTSTAYLGSGRICGRNCGMSSG